MRKFTILLACLCIAMTSFAQDQRNCASMEHLQFQMDQDPDMAMRMQAIENFTSEIIANGAAERSVNGVITIPVIVHVLWNVNQPQQNISDAQIQSQIDVLNEDFRRLNADASETLEEFLPVAADMEIEFCLASVDPQGNPTNGIERKSSTRSSWGTGVTMKRSGQGGFDAWPRDSYLNMWSCNIGGGILGFATFPGGNAADDGVVVSPQYFGSSDYDTNNDFYLSVPFDLGRTMTHEVGHWVNLRHIWGDGPCSADDFVDDTPRSDNSNYNCPLSHLSCSTKDMVQNYMDYTDDACMNIYTQGQTDRARALFEPGGARAAMINSLGCGEPDPVCNNPRFIEVEHDGDNAAVVSFTGSYFGTAYTIGFSGGDLANPVSVTVEDPQPEDFSPITVTIEGISSCVEYLFEITTACANLGEVTFTDPELITLIGPGCEPPSCDAPEDLYAMDITWQQATLGWAAEEEAENYRVQGRLKGGLGIFVRTRIIEGTSFRTNNLFPFLTYEFHVQAMCGGDLGNSPYSPWFPFTLNPITNPGFGPANDDSELEEVKLFDIDHVINAYPNPSHGPVNINYLGEDLGNARIIVSDIMGKEVQQYDVELLLNGTRQIDLSALNNGLYLLTFVKDGIHLYTEKVILTR